VTYSPTVDSERHLSSASYELQQPQQQQQPAAAPDTAAQYVTQSRSVQSRSVSVHFILNKAT